MKKMFVEKSQVFTAIQWDGNNFDEIASLADGLPDSEKARLENGKLSVISANRTDQIVPLHSWIMRWPAPCSDKNPRGLCGFHHSFSQSFLQVLPDKFYVHDMFMEIESSGKKI